MGKTAIEELLRNHGFELARQRKHKVYKRTDGTTFVTASTPSDSRAEHNQLAVLTHVLGTNKQTLLASLEKRRRRIRTSKPPAPVVEALPEPPVLTDRPLSKQDRRLLKRIARIERNRAAKKGRGTERFQSFFERLAVLFVDTDEIFFADNRGLRWRVMARRLEKPKRPSVELAARYQGLEKVDAEELLTNLGLLCLINCPQCGLTFVFRDGSIFQGSRESALELRENWVEGPLT